MWLSIQVLIATSPRPAVRGPGGPSGLRQDQDRSSVKPSPGRSQKKRE
jgi:hypothetical protein